MERVICLREKDRALSEKPLPLKDADESFCKLLRALDIFATKNIRLVAYGGMPFRLLGYNLPGRDTDLMFPNRKEYKYFTDLLRAAGYEQERSFGKFACATPNTAENMDICPGCIGLTLLEPLPGKDGNISFPLGTKHIVLELLNVYDILVCLIFKGYSWTGDALYLIETRKDINLKKLVLRYRQTFRPPRNRSLRTRGTRNLEVFLVDGINRGIRGFRRLRPRMSCSGRSGE